MTPNLQLAQTELDRVRSNKSAFDLRRLKEIIDSGRVTLSELNLTEAEYQSFDQMEMVKKA